jgi:phenylalanyl-tRNA synthetase beta chain
VEIGKPELNPRFDLGLVRNVTIQPSPSLIQRRLKMAGVRAINNIVDATNYVMLEIGQPLHAFDYDKLVQRAAGKPVRLHTRTARKGEMITTLDGVERKLDETTVLVCDDAGALSIAGIMGGSDTEVSDTTKNVLLEGAAWNMINIRKTARSQNLPSEASYRFSRGVHPSMAERGVRRGLELMHAWGRGIVAAGLVDNYPCLQRPRWSRSPLPTSNAGSALTCPPKRSPTCSPAGFQGGVKGRCHPCHLPGYPPGYW